MELLFICFSLLSITFLYLSGSIQLKNMLIFILWQIVVGLVAYYELFIATPPILLIAIILSIFISYRWLLRRASPILNIRWLLAIHLIRIPVELVLYHLYLAQQIPSIMTFTGWNFDILIGLSAAIILLLSFFNKTILTHKVLFIWNIIGCLFLLFIVGLAILSSPLPIQQLGFDQPNIAVLQFPYCLLPTCIVPIVFLSHLLLMRPYFTRYQTG